MRKLIARWLAWCSWRARRLFSSEYCVRGQTQAILHRSRRVAMASSVRDRFGQVQSIKGIERATTDAAYYGGQPTLMAAAAIGLRSVH